MGKQSKVLPIGGDIYIGKKIWSPIYEGEEHSYGEVVAITDKGVLVKWDGIKEPLLHSRYDSE